VSAAARCLDGPPAGWSELLATDPGATPAHRPALWAALAGTLPGMEARFVAVGEHGFLEGGMPVLVERRAGFRWLHALPFLLPGAPLARAGGHARVDRAAAAALAALQHELGVVGGEWALYRPGGPAVCADALERVTGETRVLEAALVDLGAGLEAARGRVDRKSRQEIRQAHARLDFADEPGALEEAYALHAAQARAWRGHRPLPLELSRRLLLPAGDGLGPAARLFTARRGAALLCAVLALDHPREVMPWWSGAHPEARRLHAFPFLLWSVVEWAHAAGRARVNLGASAGSGPVAAFKDSLGATTLRYPVRWLDAQAAPVAGRLLGAVQARWRRGRARGEAA